jgi:hypothetical protein
VKVPRDPASLLRLPFVRDELLFKQHFGDWFTVHARAERTPPRLTITFALGELPQSWARSKPNAARTWPAVFGFLLILPFAALLVANALSRFGVQAPFHWIGSSTVAIVAASLSLFVGIPVAFVINLWRIVRLGVRRRQGELDGMLALEFAPLQLAVVVAAVVIGGLFVGHLAADSYACLNGVRSAC